MENYLPKSSCSRWMVQGSKSPDPQREVDVEDKGEVYLEITCSASTRLTPPSEGGPVKLTRVNTSRGVLSRMSSKSECSMERI